MQFWIVQFVNSSLLLTILLGSEKEEPEVAEKHRGDSDEYVTVSVILLC